MRWTYVVTLRPGRDDELTAIIDRLTEAEALEDIDDWVREFGRPGDAFTWSRESPAEAGGDASGQGVVP